jgi:hypothetical protein
MKEAISHPVVVALNDSAAPANCRIQRSNSTPIEIPIYLKESSRAAPWTLCLRRFALSAVLLFAAVAVPANQVVPLTAHAKGAGGSVWRSDLRMYNPTSQTISGKLIFTERGTSRSSSDLSLAYTLAPGEVTVLQDVYELSHPGQDGVALCLVKPDGSAADPVLDPTTYNLLPDGGELSTRPTVFRPESDYFGPGFVLAGMIGKDIERTGAYVMSGPGGAKITFTGPGDLTVARLYGPDTFEQYDRADQLFEKATLKPNTVLRASITEGSARVALTRNNNATNSALWEDLEVVEVPPDPEAAASYVDKWLPTHIIWLNNRETRTLINGADGVPDHAEELATEFNADHLSRPYSTDVIRAYADGKGYPQLEVDPTKDPLQWDNVNTISEYGYRLGKVTFFTVSEPHLYTSGDPWLTHIRTLIRQSLIEQITVWPRKYGGSRTSGKPNMNHDPTWDTQDPN